ncbi:hypothetical protein V2A60_009437 [Cordyceps javanica]
MIPSTLLIAVALLALQAAAASVTTANAATPKRSGHGHCKKRPRPNIVFIMTDDQDKTMGSTDYQPLLKKYIGEQGTEFHKHFCTVSLCCPSRVSLLTGKAAHNTNVTNVVSPYGGYRKFVAEGHNENYLPVWLQQAGYNTYYTGKLMNSHGVENYSQPLPAGWNRSDYLLDPRTYNYFSSNMSLDGQEPRSMEGTYSTDHIRDRAVEFLGNGIDAGKPFFLGVAPIGPHQEYTPNGFDWPLPAARHRGLFEGLKVPRTPNFNPASAGGGAHYLASAPELEPDQLEYLDMNYQRRIEALQSVDELVEALMRKLEQHPDVLANTYVFYTSDNGYHLGQHRLPPGKCTSMEEDINVPLLVRGPGVARNASVSIPTSHTDLTPTFFRIAGIDLRDDFDGVPMPLTVKQQRQSKVVRGEHVNVEYWGSAFLEGTIFQRDAAMRNNTYKALRVVADDYDFMYTVWCTNEHMLYDMKQDRYQMHNLYGTSGNATGYPIDQLKARLDTLLLTLINCKGEVCRKPWSFVFPPSSGQKIQTLADAMDPQYDEFFGSQEAVSFSDCPRGHLLEYEGPFAPRPFVSEKGEDISEARMEGWV